MYVTVPPGTASLRQQTCHAYQLVVTEAAPGNKIEVLPAGVGKLFVSVTVKVTPSLTTSVGPGICIEGQNPIVSNAAGTYVRCWDRGAPVTPGINQLPVRLAVDSRARRLG